MSYDLKTLAQHRDALLLAEAAAWLHDIGKFCDLHIEHVSIGGSRQWSNDHAYKVVVDNPGAFLCLSDAAANLKKPAALNDALHANSPKIADFLSSDAKSALGETEVNIDEENYALAELIMLGVPGFATHQNRPLLLEGKDGWLPATMGVCHHEAHHDKQDIPKGVGQQRFPSVLTSTAFGYEMRTFVVGDPQKSLDKRLRSLPINISTIRTPRVLIRKIQEEFHHGLGDTRRPINEVTLADWASTVAALFKAALSSVILTSQKPGVRQWLSWSNKEMDHDFYWCILSIHLDGLTYFKESHRLPDLLARRELLDDALDNIQELLEVTYPLGTEVYRDETGSAFLVPHLSSDDENEGLLKALLENEIRSAFNCDSIAGEITPHITISTADRHGLKLADELAKPMIELESDPDRVAQWWQGRSDDICTVCGLRPQGPSSKSQDRGVCDTCEQRRADRAKAWTGELETTIWTDEVADTNGRLALIMGRFDLTGWLNGRLVQTLTVVDPANASSKTVDDVAKNPSFARIRRVWETTRTFWQDVLPTDEDSQDDKVDPPLVGHLLESAGPRLEIIPQGRDELDLDNFHTYELVLPGDVRLSVVWDSDKRRFITCDNLDYLAKPEQLGRPVQDVLSEGRTLTVEKPIGYGGKNKVWGEITLAKNAQELPGEYTTAIPILAEPRTFMALVPADKALDAIQAIKQKYERELGKVRNRLPLHLGAVYFHRRTPLRAALDAGRQMLEQRQERASLWRVVQDVEEKSDSLPDHLNYLADGTQQFETRLPVKLQQRNGEAKVTWHVPAVMGDGTTEDAWYPYVFLETDHEPLDRDRRFQAPNPWSGDDDWLVHAGELQKDDQVYFTPATFDFEYLDTTARRFEVSYKDGRRRGDAKAQRPYLLGDLAHIEAVWQTLRDGLATSQIKALETLIESKRRDWEKPKGAQALALPDDDPFRRLCRDALANAEWRDERWKESKDLLVCAAVSGMLADTLELHLTIAKESRKKENEEAN